MAMVYNDDQSMLRDSARDFMKSEAPVAHLRKYRDMNCKDGFGHALWKQFAEMGFTASSFLKMMAVLAWAISKPASFWKKSAAT